MKLIRATIVAAIALVIACSATAASSSSFMSKPAPDARGLVRLVAKDRALAARYAKHFGTTPAAVAEYFRENLRLGRLTRPYVTSMYTVGAESKIEKKVTTLAPGTRIFSTNWGEPILDWETGNPLTDKLPTPPKDKAATIPESKNVAEQAKTAAKEVVKAPETAGQVPTATPSGEVVSQVLAAGPTDIATGVLAPATGASAAATTPVAALPAPVATVARSANWWRPLAAIGGVGAAAAALSGGGGDAGTNPAPVPEPGSMIALSMGLGYLATRLRNRRQ